MAITLVLSACAPAAPPDRNEPPAPADAYGNPAKTYRTYLEAMKRDDLPAAKACFTVTNGTPEALDLEPGMWAAYHRFGKLVAAKFGKRECQYLREDCSDQALDRTLARLDQSSFKISGDTAKLRFRREKNPDLTKPEFVSSGEGPIAFRKVSGQWKLEIKVEDPAGLFAPGTWGWAFREGARMLDQTSNEIESGKLTKWEQVMATLDQRTKRLEKQYEKDHQDP